MGLVFFVKFGFGSWNVWGLIMLNYGFLKKVVFFLFFRLEIFLLDVLILLDLELELLV